MVLVHTRGFQGATVYLESDLYEPSLYWAGIKIPRIVCYLKDEGLCYHTSLSFPACGLESGREDMIL